MLLTQIVRSSSTLATVRAIKRESRVISKAPFTLTPAAVQRVKELLSNQSGNVGLRIIVRKRGCNGLSYALNYATEKEKFDEEVRQDGVSIFMDKKAQLTLIGTEMDFFDGQLSSEFVFNNPNITGTCGCGESFSL